MSTTPTSSAPQVLILASRFDFTCDYVVAQLRRKAIPYFRLNTEDLNDAVVELDPVRRSLDIYRDGKHFCVLAEHLRSVYFRRPVFLREYGDDSRSPGERFSRHQWAAFTRNLMLFDDAFWINDPAATYRSEHKAVQLWVAAKEGFAVPETRVTNAPSPDLLGFVVKNVALKGLDTVLLRHNGYEMFGFTTFQNTESLDPTAWMSAPVTMQTALINKLDIRVTVVGDRVFAASITVDGQPIAGDWRTAKARAQFAIYWLPKDVERRCCQLTKSLGLVFGGIDLTLCEGEYYFLEVNPTGEWAWLVDAAGLPIDGAIADELVRERSHHD